MHQLYSFLFSPQGGGWGYSFIGPPGPSTFITIVVLVPLTLVVLRILEAQVQRRQWIALLALLTYGFGAQLALRSLAPTSLGEVVASRGANGFFDVARAYSPADVLTRYHQIAADLPMHARANLPGKTLFFHVLFGVTNSPDTMGLLILLVSTLGAGMVYFLAREWIGDRRLALFAAAFYLFMPSRLYFLPGMNGITPLWLLLPMCLIELYMISTRWWWLVAAGVASYGLVMFEPLPLAAVPIVAAQVVRQVSTGRIDWRSAGVIAGSVAVTVAAVHVTLVAIVGFNIVSAFFAALADARAFNVATARPYALWVGHDIKDFLLHMGIGQSALVLAAVIGRSAPDREGAWLRWLLVAVLVTLAMLGVNRGEVARLWIFLGVLWQIAAAGLIGRSNRTAQVVLTLAIIQSALLLSMIRWVEA